MWSVTFVVHIDNTLDLDFRFIYIYFVSYFTCCNLKLLTAETFDLYARSFGSLYAKSFCVMWGIMPRLVAYTMFVVTQSMNCIVG